MLHWVSNDAPVGAVLPEESRRTLAMLEADRRADLRLALEMGFSEDEFNRTYPRVRALDLLGYTRDAAHILRAHMLAADARESGLILSLN